MENVFIGIGRILIVVLIICAYIAYDKYKER